MPNDFSLNQNKIKNLNEYSLLLDIADISGDKKISKEELAKLNTIFNNKQGVKFVDAEKLLKQVMEQTSLELEYKDSPVHQTAQYVIEDDSKKNPLADAIYRELKGSAKITPDTERLESLLKLVNQDNYKDISSYFEWQYGEDLTTLIESSVNLNTKQKYNFSVQINAYTEEKKEYTPKELAEALYNDICTKTSLGFPTTGKDFQKHIYNINIDNVFKVLQQYKEVSKGASLISDIMEERGLSIDTRIQYAKHIFSALVDLYKSNGIYVDDIVESFNKELEYQKDTWKPANSERLDVLIEELYDRYRGKIGYPQNENIQYNGKIDKDFKQGSTGDCWLVASIKAIAMEPKGLEILNDSIKIDSNGNATVTLKGVNKTYKFTKEEIYAHTEYATGDLDVRILEMAVNKYFEEERRVNGEPDINSNQEYVAFSILTGKGNRNFLSASYGRIPEFWFTDKQIDNFNKPNHIACVSAQSTAMDSKNTIELTDTNGNPTKLCKNHAYAVSGSDANYVYLINPWDTSAEIPVDRKTFKEFFNCIDEFDL